MLRTRKPEPATSAVTVSKKVVTLSNQTARMAPFDALRHPWERLSCPYCARTFECVSKATFAHTRQRSRHLPRLHWRSSQNFFFASDISVRVDIYVASATDRVRSPIPVMDHETILVVLAYVEVKSRL
jgi:hypothetical protein